VERPSRDFCRARKPASNTSLLPPWAHGINQSSRRLIPFHRRRSRVAPKPQTPVSALRTLAGVSHLAHVLWV
jgi:hypothetical protein